ncbi:MAG: hypothetical protein JSS04_15785 [Proteobacteria bacterium]|nr:hypothetical protein [Pseudomonadota bacterium]
MTLRYSLLLGTALLTVAGAADAQQNRSREDLLDALTRHIQICAEISDSQARLSCYDKVQTDVGSAPARAPTPTPLASNQPPPPPPNAPPPPPPSGSVAAGQVGQTSLAPPPLMVPGGGQATLGGNAPSSSIYAPPPGSPSSGPTPLAPPSQGDPDAAFNPHSASASQAPAGSMPRPQPPLRRTGPRPVPSSGANMPVVTLQVNNLTYGAARYWQVTVAVTSNVARTVDTQVKCSFLNGGRSVGDAYLGPVQLAAGEQVSTELIGPPTTTFVDSTNCRVLSP